MRLVNWQSSTRELSQIWLQVREESRLYPKPRVILATYKNLIWSKCDKFNFCFLQNMVTLGLLFLKNPLNRWQPILFLVTKWQKSTTKITLVITCSFTSILSMAILMSSYYLHIKLGTLILFFNSLVSAGILWVIFFEIYLKENT